MRDRLISILSVLLTNSSVQYVHLYLSGKGSQFAENLPCSDNTVDHVLQATAKQDGLAELVPHNLRRTHIPEGLNSGATIADRQVQASHVNATSTLHYAQATDAIKRHSGINFRFA